LPAVGVWYLALLKALVDRLEAKPHETNRVNFLDIRSESESSIFRKLTQNETKHSPFNKKKRNKNRKRKGK
jgi:hypothetical protein